MSSTRGEQNRSKYSVELTVFMEQSLDGNYFEEKEIWNS
jgi:hypothetical protein